MGEWKEVELGECIELFDHQRIPLNGRERAERKGLFPYYGAQGVIDWVDGFLFDGSFILVAEDGENLRSRKLPLALRAQGQFWVNNHAHVFKPRAELADELFLLYSLNHIDVRPFVTGTAQPKLSQGNLRAIPLRVAPLPIQRRIGSVLSAYDDLIENNTKRIGVLEEMARVLYRETFSRDDGVGEPMLVSELIERGVLEVNDGYRAKNTELGTPGIPFARAGDINGGFLFDEADRLLDENVPRAGRKVSAPGDIVFTSKGTVGRFAWVRETTQRFVYSPQLCFWRVLRPELLSARYVYRWMQTRTFLDQVDQVKGTTDMADYVSLSNQKRMRVTIPPIDRQRRYDELAGPIDELVGNLTDRTQRLRAARDLLLPKLLSGELSVDRIPDPAEVAP